MAPVLVEDIVIPPKDEEELELEKLVFGDLNGFEINLKKIDNLYDYSSDDEQDDDDLSDSDLSQDGDEEHVEGLKDDQLFFVDEGENDADLMDVDSQEEEEEEEDEEEESSSSDNAWSDSDDENINISLYTSDKMRKLRKTETDSIVSGRSYINRLRSQFEKIYPRPQWADDLEIEEDGEEEEEGDEEYDSTGLSTNALLKFLETNQTHNNVSKNFKLLPPNKLDITRLKDANQKHPSKSAIQTMSFHQSQPLLLTGGYDRTLRIYHIDGTTNNFITSLHLRNSPIQTASFQNSNKIFAGGRRKFMYKWDISSGELEKISRLYGHESTQRSFENFKISPDGSYIGLMGNSGWINVLNGSTGQWIKGFKIEGTLADIEFSKDKDHSRVILIAVNSHGEVWEWNVMSGKIINKWKDDSGLGVTKLKLGGANNKWVAIGNNVGIVNIYDRYAAVHQQKSIKPVATIENLVTTISSLEFSPDGQILAIASRAKKDALRLVHLPSFKVFSNWPTSGTPLGRVTSVSFTPNGEMLAVGNEQGKVRLWKLNHY